MELLHRYSKLPKLLSYPTSNTSPSRQISHSTIHCIKRRLGRETIAQLVADYQTGLSTAVLMERYHLGKGPVLRILDQAGVTRHPNKLSDEQLVEAAELYCQGW